MNIAAVFKLLATTRSSNNFSVFGLVPSTHLCESTGGYFAFGGDQGVKQYICSLRAFGTRRVYSDVEFMIPFLHLGPITIPTFGLMVATALLVSAYILQADFDRRRDPLARIPGYASQRDEGFLIIGVAGIAGLIGARLYHVLESPSEFFADPWNLLFSRFGFAWFGGFLGGFAALIILAHRSKIPLLEFLDICSPAASVGYAIGRIGCLLSGDGDYGRPTSWHWPWGMAFPHGVVPTTETCVQAGWPSDCRVYPTPFYEFF